MTNEEKAKLEYPVTQARDVGFYCDVYVKERQIFTKACEWKDQQFKKLLEKKREEFVSKACEIVRDLANEYFGDWEQSCKFEDKFREAMTKTKEEEQI